MTSLVNKTRERLLKALDGVSNEHFRRVSDSSYRVIGELNDEMRELEAKLSNDERPNPGQGTVTVYECPKCGNDVFEQYLAAPYGLVVGLYADEAVFMTKPIADHHRDQLKCIDCDRLTTIDELVMLSETDQLIDDVIEEWTTNE